MSLINTGPYCYDSGARGDVHGIIFYLPSHNRFIPYSWLLHSEVNEAGTELHFYYTHSMVTVFGTNLGTLQKDISEFLLKAVREMARHPLDRDDWPTVSRIEISEVER